MLASAIVTKEKKKIYKKDNDKQDVQFTCGHLSLFLTPFLYLAFSSMFYHGT